MSVATLRNSFRSLASPAYRWFFFGQAASRTGTRMQDVALGWYVLQETRSGTALGLLFALEYLPLLFLGPLGGSLVDRLPKRATLVTTQTLMASLAMVLAVSTHLGSSVAIFYGVALLRGVLACVDIPGGHAFVSEIVPSENIRSAVSLNSFLFNFGRLIGPILATGMIALAGTEGCFLANCFTFLLFAFSLTRIDPDHLVPSEVHANTGIREGFAYARGVPELKSAMVMMASVSAFTYSAQTLFPLLASDVLGGDVNTYA